MIQKLVLFLASVFLFYSMESQAEGALDFSIHQEYVSTRALGMGNAFSAVVNDHSAIFYNPAALARREDGQLHFFLRASIDEDYFKLTKDIDNAKGQEDDVQAISDLIEANYGNHYHARVPTLGGMWVRPNWGVAFIPADLSVDVGIHRQVGPSLNVNAYLDSTLAYAYARNFDWFGKDHLFSMGATVKALHRVFFSDSLAAAAMAADQDIFDKNRAKEGMTVDLDIGTLYTPPIPQGGFFSFLKYMKPTFAIVVRNALDYGFPINFNIIDDNSKEPPNAQRRFDFGSSFELPKFWVFDPKVALDIRDVGHDNWTPKKGFHMGAEMYWTMFNWWKGHWSVGLNQGYWTAGFGARMAWFQLDVASYGEEVGTRSVPIESRRYMAELSLDF